MELTKYTEIADRYEKEASTSRAELREREESNHKLQTKIHQSQQELLKLQTVRETSASPRGTTRTDKLHFDI